MIRKAAILSILFIFIFQMCVYADTLYVGSDKDYPSITDAIAACEDGDEIVISGGVYDETTETFPIEPEKSVYLHAAEGESVTIKPPITFIAMKIHGAGSRIEGISFEFIRSASVHVLADDVVIDNCHFELGDIELRETSCGMWIGGAKNVTVRNTDFVNSSIALAGPPVFAPSSEVPVLTALFEVGEDVEFFTTHTIENCSANGRPIEYLVGLKDQEYTSDAGQIIAACCENVTFKDLDLSCASIGIQLAYSDHCNVIDTQAKDCGIFGIYLPKCTDCCVSNSCADNGGHGIDLRDCDRCLVDNCQANECGQGIFFTWGLDCTLTNSQMINDGTGFYAASGVNTLIDNCIIGGNELGLYLQRENYTITNTEIYENTSCGLRTSDSEVVCRDNLFRDNLVGSLALDSTAVYSGNTFTGSELNDLYFKRCTDMEYEENVFTPDLEETVVIE